MEYVGNDTFKVYVGKSELLLTKYEVKDIVEQFKDEIDFTEFGFGYTRADMNNAFDRGYDQAREDAYVCF